MVAPKEAATVPTASNILATKLSGIVLEVKHVPKRGYNQHHKYDYVTESDMVEALRDALAKANVVMIPSYEHIETVKTEKGLLVTIRGTFTFTDGTDKYYVQTIGSGYDIPGDKAVYKAMTGAQKYALKQLFLIPTGDDPERDGEQSESTSGADRRPETPTGRTASPSPAQPVAPVGERNSGTGNSGGSPAARRQDDPTVTFGKNKGKKLSELKDSDLAWWTKAMEESVAKNDPKWHDKNVSAFSACQVEWARRQPWRQFWNTILEDGSAFGLDKDGIESVLKEEFGIASADALKAEHVEQFKKYLDQMNEN